MSQTTVLEVEGLHWATSAAAVEATLLRRPGVIAVEANAVSQTATVTYDPEQTSLVELSQWVRDCGYHCAGRSVPEHVCDPMSEPTATATSDAHEGHDAEGGHDDQAGHDAEGGHDDQAVRSPQETMGHGGGHGGMSMDNMVRDMRNRFLVAAIVSVPILLWSPIGRDVLGFSAGVPFGLRDDVFALLLSLPVMFYSAWIFFDGAYRALKARTLDMMVLVAVGVGAGWLYSVVVTLTGGGEVV